MTSTQINSLADSVKALGEYDEPSGAAIGILKTQEFDANRGERRYRKIGCNRV